MQFPILFTAQGKMQPWLEKYVTFETLEYTSHPYSMTQCRKILSLFGLWLFMHLFNFIYENKNLFVFIKFRSVKIFRASKKWHEQICIQSYEIESQGRRTKPQVVWFIVSNLINLPGAWQSLDQVPWHGPFFPQMCPYPSHYSLSMPRSNKSPGTSKNNIGIESSIREQYSTVWSL